MNTTNKINEIAAANVKGMALQRARDMEHLEGQLERVLTQSERTAFEIGYSGGAEWGLARAQETLKAVVEGL